MNNHGYIQIKLGNLIKERKLSKNKFCYLAQMQHTQLNSYCNNKITKIDTDVLARMCAALNCRIEDVLEYISNEASEEKNIE